MKGPTGFTLKEGAATEFPWIDFPLLLNKLVTIMWAAAKFQLSNSNYSIVGEMATQAKMCLVGILTSKPELFKVLFAVPAFPEFICTTLLEATHHRLREELVDGICSLCTKLETTGQWPADLPRPRDYFLPLLVNFLPTINIYSSSCEQYFDGLNVLIKNMHTDPESEKILAQVVGLIKEHPIIEVREFDREDKVLIGLMDLVCTFIQLQPKLRPKLGLAAGSGLVGEVFKCLFDLPGPKETDGSVAPPKCKSRPCRKAAFQLLEELTKDCDATMEELQILITSHHLGKKQQQDQTLLFFFCCCCFVSQPPLRHHSSG
jgi:hypothetical protein